MRHDYVTQMSINTLNNAQLNALRAQDIVDKTTQMFSLTENLFDSMWGLWYKKPTNNDNPATPRKKRHD